MVHQQSFKVSIPAMPNLVGSVPKYRGSRWTDNNNNNRLHTTCKELHTLKNYTTKSDKCSMGKAPGTSCTLKPSFGGDAISFDEHKKCLFKC